MTLSYTLSIKRRALYGGHGLEHIEEAELESNPYLSSMSVMQYDYLELLTQLQ